MELSGEAEADYNAFRRKKKRRQTESKQTERLVQSFPNLGSGAP